MFDPLGVFDPDHALALHATQREWQYAERNDALVGRFRPALGHGGETRDVVTGTHDGRPFVALRHVYAERRHQAGAVGSHGPTWRSQAVVGLNIGARVPALSATPKGLFGSLFSRDVQIGVPAFDDAYTVSTGVPEFARDLLCPAVLEVLMAERRSWHFLDDTLLVVEGAQLSVPFVDGALHAMDAVLDRIPAPVWARLKGEQ
jgi:hypothetical protein